MQAVIKIQELDNVAVALKDIESGEELFIGNDTVNVKDRIPSGHKIALKNFNINEAVIKYGHPIGLTTAQIKKGEWVHTHNLRTGLGDVLEYSYQPIEEEIEYKNTDSSFYGYRREKGKAGIRNEIWIIPTVGCVNDIARLLERKGKDYLIPGIDEIAAFTHPYGCSQLGEDHLNTQKILAALINHPNAAGVLVLGLGCENNHIAEMKKQIGPYHEDRVKFLVCQDSEDEIEQGITLIKELIQYGAQFKRELMNVNELIIGLKCGGSDGLSGITANPVVGAFSDLLISKGGTTILTEVPEMFGAETILMNRCENEALFHKTVALINNFKQYYKSYNQPIYENPSPGNKEGGISTLEDKSLGCTQKAGKSYVKGVIQYGEQVTTKGLNLLSSPGNDIVAATALAAAGAHIILFTTGRGTPFGSQVPTAKISSNTALFQKKKGWIDFNAGELIEGKTMQELTEELYQRVIRVASGEQVKSEINGYRDLAIFKQGVTL